MGDPDSALGVELSDDGFVDLLGLCMVWDTAEYDAVRRLADKAARERGHDGWVEAYYEVREPTLDAEDSDG